MLEFAAALSSLSTYACYSIPSVLCSSHIPLCCLRLNKLGDFLLDRLVIQPLQCDLLLLAEVCGIALAVFVRWWKLWRTVSRVEGGLDAAGLTDEDGRVRVVLLHGRVAALEEVPATHISLSFTPSSPLDPAGAHRNLVECRWGRIPCRSAVLAGLAEQKPQLLQPRIKRILGRHCVCSNDRVGGAIGVCVCHGHIFDVPKLQSS